MSSKKSAAKTAPAKKAAKATPKAAKTLTDKNNFQSVLVENRVFKPSAEFSKKARISSMAQYKKMHAESI